MVMTQSEKVRLLGILAVLAIPVVMLTPYGLKTMHDWGVARPGSPFWLSTAIFCADLTLQGETAADYKRERSLLWDHNDDAGEQMFIVLEKLISLGQVSERTDKNRMYTRAWIIIEHLQKFDYDHIEVECEDGTKFEYRLKGLTAEHKAEIVKYRDYLSRESQKTQGDKIWPDTMIDRWDYRDGWDKRKIYK